MDPVGSPPPSTRDPGTSDPPGAGEADTLVGAAKTDLGSMPTVTGARAEVTDRSRSSPARGGTGAPADRIARFVLMDELGAGGMGVVYSAFDPQLQRVVALKLLHTGHLSSQGSTGRQRLVREAQAMAALAHPNVLPVFDVGEHGGDVFVAMELVRGQTLREWARQARPWRQVVDAFVQAGRGLAAAHAEGMVHRDFKPDNVMLGDDGRVRVMDFGLVQRAREDSAITTEPDQAEGPISAGLTATGGVLGTPAYMSPEQHRGEPSSPASDQFGYCVALWELLYGARPFQGDTLMALAAAILDGNRVAPPEGRRIPAWLRAVCERGLSSSPDDRFENMNGLLGALDSGMSRARRVRQGLALAGVAAAVAAIPLASMVADARARTRCHSEADARVAEWWAESARTKLQQGIAATGIDAAGDTADRAVARLDGYAARWREVAVEACISTRVEGDWDEELGARASWCLDDRSVAAKVVVDGLVVADSRSAYQAVSAVVALPRVEPCGDPSALRRAPAPPERGREQAFALRRALGRVGALQRAARFDEALTLADDNLAAALDLAWPPMITRARISRARILAARGQFDEEVKEYEGAYFNAMRSGDFQSASEAADKLTGRLARDVIDLPRARTWQRHAEAALILAELDGETLEYAVHLTAGALYDSAAGAYDASLDKHQRALAVKRDVLGDDHPFVGTSLTNVAMLSRKTGQRRDALPYARQAVAIFDGTYGPDHPAGLAAMSVVAAELEDQGELEAAVALHERMLRIRERTQPADHPDLALTLHGLAGALVEMGRTAEARTHLERAVEIATAANGEEHPDVGREIHALGQVVRRQEGAEAALPLVQRAVAIYEATLGPEHPRVSAVLDTAARLHADLGDVEGARQRFERAIAIRAEALGANHPSLRRIVVNLAHFEVEHGNPRRAVELLEQVRPGYVERYGADHPLTLSIENRLGRAQREAGEPRAALETHDAALETAKDQAELASEEAEARFGRAQAMHDLGRPLPEVRAEAHRAMRRLDEDDQAMRAALEAWLESLDEGLPARPHSP